MAGLCGGPVPMIFQEPTTALDPVFTIGQQIAETVVRQEGASRESADARALELLELVQVPSANDGWRPTRTSCRAVSGSGR